jgi:hypothetical protein
MSEERGCTISGKYTAGKTQDCASERCGTTMLRITTPLTGYTFCRLKYLNAKSYVTEDLLRAIISVSESIQTNSMAFHNTEPSSLSCLKPLPRSRAILCPLLFHYPASDPVRQLLSMPLLDFLLAQITFCRSRFR